MSKASEISGIHREKEQIDRSIVRVVGAETMDQDARDLGHKAVARIDAHEILCTERWLQQRVAVAALQGSFDIMSSNMLGRIPAGIIAILTGLVGWLAARAFPTGH